MHDYYILSYKAELIKALADEDETINDGKFTKQISENMHSYCSSYKH
jgi:hypothetical protein